MRTSIYLVAIFLIVSIVYKSQTPDIQDMTNGLEEKDLGAQQQLDGGINSPQVIEIKQQTVAMEAHSILDKEKQKIEEQEKIQESDNPKNPSEDGLISGNNEEKFDN